MPKLGKTGYAVRINSGQTASAGLTVTRLCQSCTIIAPATLPETVAVQVAVDDSGWATLKTGQVDVTLSAARATIIINGGFTALRLLAGSSVAADRLFTVGLMVSESQGNF